MRISISVQHRGGLRGGVGGQWMEERIKINSYWYIYFIGCFYFHPLRRPRKRPTLQLFCCGNGQRVYNI